MNRTEYFKLRKEYTDEISTYKQRLGWYTGNQTLIAHYSYLLVATESRLEALEAIGYDDNDVYRTGERQLDTRIDGCIVLAGGQLSKNFIVGANKYIVA